MGLPRPDGWPRRAPGLGMDTHTHTHMHTYTHTHARTSQVAALLLCALMGPVPGPLQILVSPSGEWVKIAGPLTGSGLRLSSASPLGCDVLRGPG